MYLSFERRPRMTTIYLPGMYVSLGVKDGVVQQ